MNAHNARLREESQARIKRKLERLQELLANPESVGEPYPDDIEAFREWEDEIRNLERIGSPSTMNQRLSPHNRSLILRVQKCIARLNARQKIKVKRPPLKEQLDAANNKNRTLEETNKELVSELHRIRFDYEVLANSHRRMRDKQDPPVKKIR